MTDTEIESLKENKDPLVKALLEEYLEYVKDPRKKFFLECSQMLEVISEDMKTIRQVNKDDEESMKAAESSLKILGSSKDDKLFDRIMAVLTNAGKISDNIAALQDNKPSKEKGRAGKSTKDDDIPSAFS